MCVCVSPSVPLSVGMVYVGEGRAPEEGICSFRGLRGLSYVVSHFPEPLDSPRLWGLYVSVFVSLDSVT